MHTYLVKFHAKGRVYEVIAGNIIDAAYKGIDKAKIAENYGYSINEVYHVVRTH